ncbi:hypothetical protein NUSPORA_01575 [Nucleospora cyclopteri]
MSFKRKRNIKFEITGTYSVFMLDAINNDELEDYEEIKATGMEEEEEKELHLRKVIEGQNKSIPLPVIENIENPCEKYYKKTHIDHFINWQDDVKNIYVESKEDIKILNEMKKKEPEIEQGSIKILSLNFIECVKETSLASKNMSSFLTDSVQCFDLEAAVKCFGDEQKNYGQIKNRDFVDFVLRRCLIRHEKFSYEAYICFKPRVLLPKIKSRKNENHTAEKLTQLHEEFEDIRTLCLISRRRMKIEHNIFNSRLKMIEEFGDVFSSSIRKKINFKKPKADINDVFYLRKKLKPNFTNIEPYLDGNYFDKNILPLETIHVKQDSAQKEDNSKEITKLNFEDRFKCQIE